MQTMKFLFLVGLLAGTATADDVNPIQKVIEMLSALQAKLLKEGEAEEKAYKEFFEWCDDAAKEKKFEIKTATSQKEKLEATITKSKSDADEASEIIEELSAAIASNEADLKAATAIREKEFGIFSASETELMSSVDMLERAISVLEREMGGSALLQSPVDTSSVNALIQSVSVVIDAAAFSVNDKQKLLSLIQNKQGDEDDDSELGAPAPDAYKSKSGGIVDVLTDMKEKAEAQLSEERKAEKNSKHNYDMMKLSLEDEIAADSTEMEEAKKNKGEAEETIAASEGDLAVCVNDLAEATQSLEDIGGDCMDKATTHELSKKGRAEELKVLDTAKKIIQSSTFLDVSFLQVSSTARVMSKVRTGADLKQLEVVNVVKRLAAQQHSAALTQLASRIAAMMRYGTASGEDPFAKIKGLITDMIEKLMKEAAEEASKKAYCDEEMSKTKAKKDELTGDIEKLTTKIDKATSKSVELKDEVKELQKELADLVAMQAEMDKVREDTHAAFVATKEELDKGLDGIRKALKVLRDFYQSKEEALLQGSADFNAFMQQPAVPEKHEKATGAGGGIISMLEVIESDMSKELAAEEAEEETAQTEYEKLTQENKITKSTKEQDVKYKTKEFQSLDKAVAELSVDRDGAQTELDAVLEYYEKIKDECIAKPETYEERKKRREAEIAGLKEALSILEGQALLQRSSGRSGLRGIAMHSRM